MEEEITEILYILRLMSVMLSILFGTILGHIAAIIAMKIIERRKKNE